MDDELRELIEAISTPGDAQRRRELLSQLRGRQEPEVLDLALWLLNRADATVRAGAAEVLASFADLRAVTALSDVRGDPLVGKAAREALRAIGTPAALAALEPAPLETPSNERWSALRKAEVVLRVIRGEAIALVAREIQVPVHEVEKWYRVFLESGQQGLEGRGVYPEAGVLRWHQAEIDDMTMRLELAEHLLEKRGFAEDARKLRK